MLHVLAFLLLASASALLTYNGLRQRFGTGILSRRADFPVGNVRHRLRRLWGEVLLQKRVFANRPLVGLLHALVLWGFLAFGWISARHLFAGIAGREYIPEPGGLYGALVALWAVAVALAILALAFRRFVLRPAALGEHLSLTSAVVTSLIVTLMATYLLDYSGVLVRGSAAGYGLWWVHTLALLAFPPVIVRSKHLHLLLAPAAIFLRSETTSRMRPLDLENDDLGLTEFKQLSLKNILDINACVECGRCTDSCPAHRSGGSLSPKQVVLDIRDGSWVNQEDLFQCYACGACEQACPVGIEHVGGLILDLRRGLVSNEHLENEKADATFAKMNKSPHNPWGFSSSMRDKFVEDEKFPIFNGQGILFWLGCGISYDSHGQAVAKAMRRILDAANITWGVLPQETCCGEPARRLGNEMLFLELSGKLVETFRKHNVKNIVTCCPHCTVMLDADYRQLPEYRELHIVVRHHTEFLQDILDLLPLKTAATTIAYHDPCNLSRGRNVTAQPRNILRECGATLQEPAEHGHNTMCCGAGGGQMFIADESKEGPADKRVNVQRFQQLAAGRPEAIAVACPYCPIMLADAAKAAGSQIPVLDIAEIVSRQLDERRGYAVFKR